MKIVKVEDLLVISCNPSRGPGFSPYRPMPMARPFPSRRGCGEFLALRRRWRFAS